MWTDFAQENALAMIHARQNMNDFRLIRNLDGSVFSPEDSVTLHRRFVKELLAWLNEKPEGPCVVITHHAPVINPHTKYKSSPLQPAFNSLDMQEIIEAYQPDFWFYGHTHECDDQNIGRTRIISNQLGYYKGLSGYECLGFDPAGKPITL